MKRSLELISPPFDSPVVDLIIEIDYLRKKKLSGSTHPMLFFQLKEIFHILESIGSTRIEGNHTTVAQFLDSELYDDSYSDEIQEIKNNERALCFIEKTIDNSAIDKSYICELHRIVVDGLMREGSSNPGAYRSINPAITGSKHIPPGYGLVENLMEDLFLFINRDDSEKYDLLKIAIAHHRFVLIHPFDNGNGRTVRLLTYAMLIKKGFNVHEGRIINPTAVFCSNRDAYYRSLQEADTGTDSGVLNWIEYMLKGLKEEIEKIDNLLEADYVKNKILFPALSNLNKKRIISDKELKILKLAVDKQEFKTSDLNKIFPDSNSTTISRNVKRLRDKNLLIPEKEGSRKYFISFTKNELMREIIRCLDKEGFLPMKGEI